MNKGVVIVGTLLALAATFVWVPLRQGWRLVKPGTAAEIEEVAANSDSPSEYVPLARGEFVFHKDKSVRFDWVWRRQQDAPHEEKGERVSYGNPDFPAS